MVEDAVVAPAAPPPIVLDGVGTPDANGLSDTEEAPGYAGLPADAEGPAGVVLEGFRTLNIELVFDES